MRRLTELLAAELRMFTPTCLTLAKYMSAVFKPAAKIHKTAFQDTSSSAASTLNDTEMDRAQLDLRDGAQNVMGLSEQEI